MIQMIQINRHSKLVEIISPEIENGINCRKYTVNEWHNTIDWNNNNITTTKSYLITL